MKKVIILSLVAMLAFTGFTFADEIDSPPQRQEREKTGDFKSNLTEVLVTYNPDLLVNFNNLWANHDAIHLDLELLKDNHKAAMKAQKEALRAEMKALIEAETLTKEEAKLVFEEEKTLNQEAKALVRAEIDALKVTYGVDKDQMKALVQVLKTAVEAEDAGQVNQSLLAIYSRFENHIAFDQAKYTLLVNR